MKLDDATRKLMAYAADKANGAAAADTLGALLRARNHLTSAIDAMANTDPDVRELAPRAVRVADAELRGVLALFDEHADLHRVSGDCPCPVCGLPYDAHPTHAPSQPHEPTRLVACDGRQIKV